MPTLLDLLGDSNRLFYIATETMEKGQVISCREPFLGGFVSIFHPDHLPELQAAAHPVIELVEFTSYVESLRRKT